jgi:ferredoxin
MIHRQRKDSGGGNRRRMGERANCGRGGGRRRGQAGGKGRRGKLEMIKGSLSGSLVRESSFRESGALKHGTGEFKSDNETLIQKVRYIKERIREIENARKAPAAPKETPVRLPDAERGISKITAVVNKKKCICCGICIEMCPEHAISTKDDFVMGEILIDSDKCNACGTCASVCPNEAISLPGVVKAAV